MPDSSGADGHDLHAGRDFGQRRRLGLRRRRSVPRPRVDGRARLARLAVDRAACADRTRAACARRSCSSARPSPRPARRLRQRGPTAERGFSSRRADRFDLRSANDGRDVAPSKAAGSRGSNRGFRARPGLRDRMTRLVALRTTGSPASVGRILRLVPRAERTLRLARPERTRLGRRARRRLRALSDARHRPFAGAATVARIPAGAAPVATFLHGHRLISVCSPFQVTASRSPFMASVIGWRVIAPPLEHRPSM